MAGNPLIAVDDAELEEDAEAESGLPSGPGPGLQQAIVMSIAKATAEARAALNRRREVSGARRIPEV